MGEVAQATAYIGAKKVDDDDAYERISTIDEDDPELTVFFDEGRANLVSAFMQYLKSEGMESDDEHYFITLNVSDKFNLAVQPAMQIALFNYYVHWILYRWYMITYPDMAADEFLKTESLIASLQKQAYFTRIFTRKISVL